MSMPATNERDYKETRTYERADSAGQSLIERYVEEQEIDADQLFDQLYLNDLSCEISAEERKKASAPGEFLMVGAIIFSVSTVATMQAAPIFISTAFLFLMSFLFFTGRLNAYEQEKRRVRKVLKAKQPNVQRYGEWCRERGGKRAS